MQELKKLVCSHYAVDDIKGKTAGAINARRVTVYLLREHISLFAIAEETGIKLRTVRRLYNHVSCLISNDYYLTTIDKSFLKDLEIIKKKWTKTKEYNERYNY